MQKTNIDKYREIFDRYLEQDLTRDDLKLEKKVEHFYKFKKTATITDIVEYLKKESINPDALVLADELEKLLASGPIVAEPAPVSNSSAAIPDKISAPDNAIYAFPPGYAKVKAVEEALPEPKADKGIEESQSHNTGATVQTPVQDGIFYIEPTAEVKIHELAAIFPIMEGQEFEDFKISINAGQQFPIVMYENIVIDGRQRLKACQELGIKIMAVNWKGTGSVEEFIYASNVARRHLNAGQRAAFAVKILPNIAEEAAQRKKAGKAIDHVEKIPQGRSAYLAGEKLGVNGKYVIEAKKVSDASGELFNKVLTGEVSLSQATREIKSQKGNTEKSEQIKYSVAEAIVRILNLVAEDAKDELNAIAAASPPVVYKAIQKRLNEEVSITSEDNEDTGEDIIQQPTMF